MFEWTKAPVRRHLHFREAESLLTLHGARHTAISIYKFGVLFVGLPIVRAPVFGACIRAPDFWTLPYRSWPYKLLIPIQKRQALASEPEDGDLHYSHFRTILTWSSCPSTSLCAAAYRRAEHITSSCVSHTIRAFSR